MASHPPPAAGSGPALLDHNRLEALDAASGPERIRPLIRLFAESAEARWAELKRLGSAGDLDSVHAAAHDIAGSAGNFGAWKLEMAARQAMAACAERDRDAVRAGIEVLEPVLEQTLEEFRQRYGLKRD